MMPRKSMPRKPDYEEATPSEVEKIPTRQLLTLRDSCYKNNLRSTHNLGDGLIEDENGVVYDEHTTPPLYAVYRYQSGHTPNLRFDPALPITGSNQKNAATFRSVTILLKDILYELNKRPHVPGSDEAKRIRQSRAKTGKSRGRHDR
jgi:hypothetical protein